mgnify:CR=1 FL=1
MYFHTFIKYCGKNEIQKKLYYHSFKCFCVGNHEKKLTFRTALESLKKSIWSFWTCKKKWKKLNWENETKRRNKTLFRVAARLVFIIAPTQGRRQFQWAHCATMPFLLMVDIVHQNLIIIFWYHYYFFFIKQSLTIYEQ